MDSERGRKEAGGKRKAEDEVVDEAERKRIKKAAKKARKEKERLEASRIAHGEDPMHRCFRRGEMTFGKAH